MNERIKELAIESQPPYGNFDHEKFANLIVKDILDILADRKNYNGGLYTTWDTARADGVVIDLAKAIQTKFGTNVVFKVEKS